MQVVRYHKDLKETWDDFVNTAKNGSFLFYRGFMEYHADRFTDYSLLFYDKDELISIMPANILENRLTTHAGLTYGGLVMCPHIKATQVIEIFDSLVKNLKEQDIEKVVYKAIPHIYHTAPAEEDLYALFRLNAKLSSRQISSAIKYPRELKLSRTRKRGLDKAKSAKLNIRISDDWKLFWNILSNNLQKNHDTKPVHSVKEIIYLAQKFPENIKLYAVYNNSDELIAGTVVFLNPTIVHLQYTAGSLEAKENGAIDFLINHVIEVYKDDKEYFDYGTSTEDNGHYLNEGLIYQKEGFGARAIVYDTYSISF